MKAVHQKAKENLEAAWKSMGNSSYSDKKHIEHPTFNEVELVTQLSHEVCISHVTNTC